MGYGSISLAQTGSNPLITPASGNPPLPSNKLPSVNLQSFICHISLLQTFCSHFCHPSSDFNSRLRWRIPKSHQFLRNLVSLRAPLLIVKHALVLFWMLGHLLVQLAHDERICRPDFCGLVLGIPDDGGLPFLRRICSHQIFSHLFTYPVFLTAMSCAAPFAFGRIAQTHLVLQSACSVSSRG